MRNADSEHFATVQRPAACFLAISREPVSGDQLATWTWLNLEAVLAVVREWRELLDERNHRYRISHRSSAEFLDAQESLRHCHEQVARTASAKIPGVL
ncbi:hypothetical protein [Geodermatophilus poikilotrophus]|uniref:Uncharacterized protein n=1 Tax=Geodermatophilus poikilotrophus TaxID=1333667 RepID=A0A1I0E1Z0_9ACTN|nr:hypothetical protein [Geodermatophilus poikilotrophus]SET39097.1 hypothetical protein SAMN04488546_2301 [Geodermatophilus poikilotrophus]